MDFLVNDLSLAGQFQDLRSFQDAVSELMKIRQEIQRLGSSLYCHRNLLHAQVTEEAVMQKAVQGLPPAQRSAWMQWLTKQGPYWEDAQLHDGDDWLEVNGEPVTDSAVAEAAICRWRGLPRELVSFVPSNWLFTPVEVRWVHDDTTKENIPVPNHWAILSVQASLAANPFRIDSWTALAVHLKQACTQLTFSERAFESLDGHPFARGAAERIRSLLHILDKYKGCFDDQKQRTAEGDRLYTDYFTGHKAWFTDSSDAEKIDFKNDLTFSHPAMPGQALFCTWHGKVKTPPFRIHFSWPIHPDTPLYIMYVGPKITKR